MRHSDIRLTMQTYTDPKLFDLSRAIDSLPSVAPTPGFSGATQSSHGNPPMAFSQSWLAPWGAGGQLPTGDVQSWA
jgi:hypothetical protein